MEDVSYAAMKSALKRIFSSEIAKNPMVDSNEVSVKHEKVFFMEQESVYMQEVNIGAVVLGERRSERL